MASVEHYHITLRKLYTDHLIRYVFLGILLVIFVCGICFGLFTSALLLSIYVSGLGVATSLLSNRQRVLHLKQLIKGWLGYPDVGTGTENQCQVCGTVKCLRHDNRYDDMAAWHSIVVDEALDKSVASFYSQILDAFIHSWFSLVSTDNDFMHLLRRALRDATCRLVVRLKQLDVPQVICDKLLPCAFSHYEILSHLMVTDGVAMDQLGMAFRVQGHALHPAVCNRTAELKYLRTIAKELIPKLLPAEHYQSHVSQSLIRELVAFWVLLPLLDAIADPNLLNLLVIVATDPPSNRQYKVAPRVTLLEQFVQRLAISVVDEDSEGVDRETAQLQQQQQQAATVSKDLLADQTKLYNFMQFLKREGSVDILQFHMEVNQLNNELQDPRITTDPAKLSALQQQSERLFKSFQVMAERMPELGEPKTLLDAHEASERLLFGKWWQAYMKTSEYFLYCYGPVVEAIQRDLKSEATAMNASKLSKLKGAIRTGGLSIIDGTSDGAGSGGGGIETPPTVWDAFNEGGGASGNGAGGGGGAQSMANATIYSSVTQKLRKERGQNLDQFMYAFMQSIEQTTDMGEDVIRSGTGVNSKGPNQGPKKPPGKNLVFGDLFELQRPPNGFKALTYHEHPVSGPSSCLVYIMSKVMQLPAVVTHFVIALANISRQSVDAGIKALLQKLINIGLYEPRLAVLIGLLQEQLFGDDKEAEPTATELLERQRLARQRLLAVNRHLGVLVDIMQSPAMNKHLIYTLFDIILGQLYPDVLQRVHEETMRPTAM